MRFEDYVFDKGVLSVPPNFILPNYAHLMVGIRILTLFPLLEY